MDEYSLEEIDEMNKELKKMYAVYDGEIYRGFGNRVEKRKYIKQYKHNKNATYCPNCKGNTLKITDDFGRLFCELCGKVVKDD